MYRAFTLIELLVVITVIVVLLALLTPALDRAIYQAELAVCAANLKGIATGALTYAASNERKYPTRMDDAYDWTPMIMKYDSSNDVRHVLEGWLSLKMFVDPLGGEIDLGPSRGSDPQHSDTIIYANYGFYFGWRYSGYKGMIRIGDRFVSRINPSDQETRAFRVIASDYDLEYAQAAIASHRDDDGLMTFFRHQDAANPWLAGIPGNYVTVSWWENWNGTGRGTLDTNYGMDDASVQRFTQVDLRDDRMAKVPEFSQQSYYEDPRALQLPR